MKTVALFKDPAEEKRTVTKIGWHPDAGGSSKLVASYSNLRFQRMTDEMPMSSFIWDIAERNEPLTELRSNSPMVCCQFNGKVHDWLLGGCYNGVLNWYDLKRGPTPCMKSKVEISHYDPVYDVVWMQSKTGQDCASVSSDGRILFWDCRKLDEFVDAKQNWAGLRLSVIGWPHTLLGLSEARRVCGCKAKLGRIAPQCHRMAAYSSGIVGS